MKYYFPNQNFKYIQTNRSDELGSIWSSKNLDFQKKLGTLKLSDKLVTNTNSTEQTNLGLPVAFELLLSTWWAICGTRIFRSSTNEITTAFTPDTSTYVYGGTDATQFNISNPSGTTWRYTWNTVGGNPNINATNFPIGATVTIIATGFNAANEGTFLITGSGANYFEITNPSGVVQTNEPIDYASGISVSGGPYGADYSPLYSDLVFFENLIFTTTPTKLRMSVITSFGTGSQVFQDIYTLTTGIPHKLVYFKKSERIYFIYNNRTIGSFGTDFTPIITGEYTINLGNSVGYINTMVATSSHIWIGSSPTTSKTKGTISQWDASNVNIQQEYTIEAGGVLAMCELNDVPYAIDTEGRILQYTGYSFKEIARLPIDRTLLVNATANQTQKFIHFNGMTATKNDTILINVNNLNEDANSTINENLPSGIWELDLSNNSLTHKYSPTLKSMSSSTVTDFGQNRIVNAGAIKIAYNESDSTAGRSTILAGISYYTDATTEKSAIFIDSPAKPDTDLEGQKRGYSVTTWFESFQITDNWASLWAVYKRFANATDKLIFKYRVNEEEPIEATITWTSTTTFTTTTDISAYEGFEAEIIQGTGSGACTNILTVTEDSGTYTATIDAAITGVTGTAKARFQKWIKLGEISNQVLSYGQLPIDIANTQIQVKAILEWTGDSELTKMILNTKEDINIDS